MPDRLKELRHVGIAVADLDEAKKLYTEWLGFSLAGEKELPDRGLKIAFLSSGNTMIELLQGVRQDSTIFKFVEKRGPGIHHLCFAVDDISRVMEELSSAGLEMIDKKPRLGAEGRLVAFLHPKSTLNVLIELEEK